MRSWLVCVATPLGADVERTQRVKISKTSSADIARVTTADATNYHVADAEDYESRPSEPRGSGHDGNHVKRRGEIREAALSIVEEAEAGII